MREPAAMSEAHPWEIVLSASARSCAVHGVVVHRPGESIG